MSEITRWTWTPNGLEQCKVGECVITSDHLAELQRLQSKLDEALAFERAVLAREEGQIAEVQRLREQADEVEEYLPPASGPYQTMGERAKLLKDQMEYAAEFSGDAAKRLAETNAENERLREHVRVLKEALTAVLSSAWPNEGDHPAMFRAWKEARAALAATEPRP